MFSIDLLAFYIVFTAIFTFLLIIICDPDDYDDEDFLI